MMPPVIHTLVLCTTLLALAGTSYAGLAPATGDRDRNYRPHPAEEDTETHFVRLHIGKLKTRKDCPDAEKVRLGDYVSMLYTLKHAASGKVLDKTPHEEFPDNSGFKGMMAPSLRNLKRIGHPFIVGQEKVIPGVERGVLGMCVGDKRRLKIPPYLGYGSEQSGDIPPNSSLIMDVEIVHIESRGHKTAIEMENDKAREEL